jgi:hypothetical protein
MLRRSGTIRGWHDRKIKPGDNWRDQISTHLEEAEIILLLVSPDFIASDYCYEVEMTRAIERHNDGEALVIPIILRPADWEVTPFSSLQALPKGGKPVTLWTNEDEAFKNIAEGIRKAATSFGTAANGASAGKSSRLAVSKSLQAAIARNTTVRRSTDVTVMISNPGREPLIAHLEKESGTLDAKPRDVRSEPFVLGFASIGGQAIPQQLLLRIHAPDCEPSDQNRTIEVNPGTDSRPVTLLIRPAREGKQMLNVELLSADLSLASKTMQTHARLSDLPPGGSGTPAGRVVEIENKKWLIVAAIPLEVEANAEAAGAVAGAY